MNDDNWELINGSDAHHIEQLNRTNTINLIESLLIFLRAERKRHGVAVLPTERDLKELHRTGTLYLLKNPGEFRNGAVHLVRGDGSVAYTPPDQADVAAHMAEFFDELNKLWVSGDALDVAAFALWRLNWVHPFPNGNGRTARSQTH